MSQKFILGTLAEKARLANTLVAEVLAGLPQDMHEQYHKGLQETSNSLQSICHDLRNQDRD